MLLLLELEDAKKALAGDNRILDEVRNVSTAVPDPVLSCIAKYEITFKSSMTLINLDSDCLRSIFRFLPLSDWCSIADTCSRLRAMRMTTLVHKAIDTAKLKNSAEFMKIMKKFGSGINGLEHRFNQIQPQVSLQTLQLAMDYCSVTLKSLKLYDLYCA